jgi:hypothetical protein
MALPYRHISEQAHAFMFFLFVLTLQCASACWQLHCQSVPAFVGFFGLSVLSSYCRAERRYCAVCGAYGIAPQTYF